MPNRRELLKLAAAFQSLAAAAPAATIPNSTKDKSAAQLSKETFGDLRVYFDGRTDQLGAMTFGSLQLKPGMAPHPPHQHPEEEIMVVTEGTGEISVEGKAAKVTSGSAMYCAANQLHGIVNTGKSPLLFYYFKWKA